MKLIDILVDELPKRGGWPGAIPVLVQNSSGYVYQAGGGEYIYRLELADDWMYAEVTCEKYFDELIALRPVWDGNGLPPVGCECEYETTFHGWQPVRIELIKSECIAFTWLANSEAYNGLDCVGVQKAGSFRPIRSEADKKRDEAAKGLIDYLDKETDIDNVFSTKDVIGFYDAIAAGKIPGVRIE